MSYLAKDFRKFSKNDYFEKKASDVHIKVTDINDIDHLVVEGHNLIDEENLLCKKMKGKKLLYKLEQKDSNEEEKQEGFLSPFLNYVPDISSTRSKTSKNGKKNHPYESTVEVIAENYDNKSFLKNYRVKSSK